ncbi:MAG TPA: PA2779 family protein, partial [Gammaproteobacteria bacterium]
MRTRNRNLAVLMTVTLISASLQSIASAGVISTQQYIAAIDRDATLARIDAVLAREEVRSRLEHHGVDPAAANERI